MAETAAQIVFVGLVSFLNIAGQDGQMPPPSVIVPERPGHTAFIGYNENEVSMSGATSKDLGSGFRQIDLNGDDVTFNDDRSDIPDVKLSFKDIANFSDYSNNPSKKWKEKYVPPAGKRPDTSAVKAFVRLGSGSLSAGRLTAVRYEFKTTKGDTHANSGSRCYAREAYYEFPVRKEKLVVETISADGQSYRRIAFAPKSGQPLRVWIGNAPKPLTEMQQKEPASYEVAGHFDTFYEYHEVPAAARYIPHPTTLNCDGTPLPPAFAAKVMTRGKAPHSHEGSPESESGYCGPDNRP